MSAEGDATPNEDGSYDLQGTAKASTENRLCSETPRHGSCDETTVHRMEQKVGQLI